MNFEDLQNMFDWDMSKNKQRVSMSEYAWEVIQQDKETLHYPERDVSPTVGAFINMIIERFGPVAKSTATRYIQAKNEQYESILGHSSSAKESINKLLIHEKAETKAWIDSIVRIPHKCTTTISINKKNLKFLMNNAEELAEYYIRNGDGGRIGNYIRVLLEEYSLLPYSQRELIMLDYGIKSEIDAALLSVNETQKKQLKIRVRGNASYIYMKPYAILQDSAKQYNYLVGMERKKNSEEENVWSPRSVRLSSIVSCSITHLSGKLKKSEEIKLEKAISSFGVQYTRENITDSIVVQFTVYGEDLYLHQILNQRPWYIKRNVQNRIYTFDCSYSQAMYYFERFGEHAIVLSPPKLTKIIKKWYHNSYNSYCNINVQPD